MNAVLTWLVRLTIVAAFPLITLWIVADRLRSEAVSTLYLIRCDLLEQVHYFRLGWREVPKRINRAGGSDA